MSACVWTRASYAYAACTAVILGYFLLRVPLQVTDCFLNILALDRPFLDLMRETLAERGYLRPGLWAALKGVYDLSGGNFDPWFRGTHVLQAAILLVLFVGMLQPRSAGAAAVVPLAIAVLIGSHTFAWTVLEAFPINTFLTIVICCAAAAVLAFSRYRRWNDVLAALCFAAAALTVESGLLVGVIFVGGRLLGLRGVSGRGIAAVAALMVLYFAVRFGWLGAGLPTLLDREAGYGFARRGGAELQALFGDNPLPFYAYNVFSSVMNVLAAEPRDGVWQLTKSVVSGAPDYVLLMHAISTTLASALVVRFAWRRRHRWAAASFERPDQLVLLFAIVLGSNAAIGYAYTKDVIMSPAGLFFAAAVYVACCDLIESAPAAGRSAIATALVLVALSSTWAVRAAGLHAGLAAAAVHQRDQWAYVDDFLERRKRELTPRQLAIKRSLQDAAVLEREPAPLPRNELLRFFGYCCP